MTYFDAVPTNLKQAFKRVRRSTGLAQDSYGDATFTEVTVSGFKGFFQYGRKAGETVILAGKEISYDAMVYTTATMLVGENDVLLFGSSTATAASTRFHVKGILPVYEKGIIEHKEIFVSQEVT